VPLWPTRQELNHPYRDWEIKIEPFERKARVKFEENGIRLAAVLKKETDSETGKTPAKRKGRV
jgi:hypothetical protein